ncbi:uncharacterized protein DMAD_00518 [Drosophila madeirensis]|uniref:Uncharacterized protein n=1 Tax=Drosophila madeirensis TaxID=30013 RepID=A0AAU9FWN0_DROMD
MNRRTLMMEAMKENVKNMRAEQQLLRQEVTDQEQDAQNVERIFDLNRQLVDTTNYLMDTLRQMLAEPYSDAVEIQIQLALDVCDILIAEMPDEDAQNGLPDLQIPIQNGLLEVVEQGEPCNSPRGERNELGAAQMAVAEVDFAIQNGLLADQLGERSVGTSGLEVVGTEGELNELRGERPHSPRCPQDPAAAAEEGSPSSL